MEIQRDRRKAVWTAQEDKILQEKYASLPTRTLAEQLNRTPNAVYLRAKKLDLEKSFQRLREMALTLDGHRSKRKVAA